MTTSTVRTTLVFTPKVSRLLKALAEKWNLSKSETLRKIIEERAMEEERIGQDIPDASKVIELIKLKKVSLIKDRDKESFLGELDQSRKNSSR
jgi:hypothetical protein